VVDFGLRGVAAGAVRLAERVGDEAYFAAVCVRSGVVAPELPHRAAQIALAFERYGIIGGVIATAAIRHGGDIAVIDERGELTFDELDGRSNALANAWRERGLEAGDGVAIVARNHCGLLEAVFAAAKCGAKIILLNTSFAGPQIREVAGREGTDLLVYDNEYAGVLAGIDPPRGRWRAWVDGRQRRRETDTLEFLIDGASRKPPPKPSAGPRITILTSGTTGAPKGAARGEPRSLGLLGGLLSKVPYRPREVTELSVPMFHALGLTQAMVAVGLGSTLIVRRRFDPEATVESTARYGATAVVLVPVMLRRILDLGDQTVSARLRPGPLRIIFVSGSALGVDLAKRTMAAFGPVLYNLYGSTEVAYATIATPEDLESEPGCAGRVVRGSVVKILDEQGREVARGRRGRIFVANSSQFEGYTGGETKAEVGGLMSSGDVGHFDADGRLFVDGRDDEMIISGGENVFPAEIEELLAAHEGIEEAAVIGVDDERFGQRLKAFVVVRDGVQLTQDDVKDFVRHNLAGYKTPREVAFVDELPRNPTGKVLKRELHRQH